MTLSTRQKILDYLRKNRDASARELARTLRLTEANVRHHLRHLAADGRVTELSARAEGRGRPEKVFALSAALAGDNLSGLAEALLTVQPSGWKIESLADLILDAKQFSNLPLARRLALLVEKLNELHYQSRWEAGAEGPRVLLGRCPYAAVIEKHPELCRMDASMLGKALGREVNQLGRIEKGLGVCVFVVR